MKPTLLVIDVQNEYFSPHGQWVLPEGREALESIQQLLSTFRAAHLPVVHIAHEEPDPAAPRFSHSEYWNCRARFIGRMRPSDKSGPT